MIFICELSVPPDGRTLAGLGFRHMFAIRGPASASFSYGHRQDIDYRCVAFAVLGLIGEHTTVVLLGHSTGALVSGLFLGEMFWGVSPNAGHPVDTTGLSHGKISYFLQDGDNYSSEKALKAGFLRNGWGISAQDTRNHVRSVNSGSGQAFDRWASIGHLAHCGAFTLQVTPTGTCPSFPCLHEGLICRSLPPLSGCPFYKEDAQNDFFQKLDELADTPVTF